MRETEIEIQFHCKTSKVKKLPEIRETKQERNNYS